MSKLANSTVDLGPDCPNGFFSFSDELWRAADRPDARHERHVEFDWDIDLMDGTSLLDSKNGSLLRSLKLLVWTMLYDPREGKPTSPTALSGLRGSIGSGARWLASEGMIDFSGMGEEATERYLVHFLENHEQSFGGVGRRAKITYSSVCKNLGFPYYVYRQRDALARFGLIVPRSRPFNGEGASSIATNRLDLHKGEKLSPISDDVAVVLMGTSYMWIVERSEDLIKLQNLLLDEPYPAFDDPRFDVLKNEYYKRSDEILQSFPFRAGSDGQPWFVMEAFDRRLRDERVGKIKGRQIVRWLMTSLQAACVILIQSCTGMRASDMDSLRDDVPTGELPSCVEVRRSKDGMMEHFFVIGRESKVTKTKAEWLVGSRQAGSKDLPPAVHALSVLHRLYARWRTMASMDSLFVTFAHSKGLPRVGDSIGYATSDYLSDLQKTFFAEHCDSSNLSDEDKARFCDNDELRGHLWRTTFATFVYRIDHRLIEPISRHFKHVSVLITEQRYVGNDVELIADIASAAVQSTARFFRDVVRGKIKTAGPMADALQEFPLPEESDEDDFEAVVIEEDLRLIDLGYGKCGVTLNPRKSRCNTLGMTRSWAKRSPNLSFQSLSTCSGCQLFVTSSENLPFWQNRLSTLKRDTAAYKAGGEKIPTVLRKRLAVSMQMIKRLTLD